jgi:hypothetical protein
MALALLTSVAFADHHEGKKEELTDAAKTEMAKEHHAVAPNNKEQKRAAYKAAKEACLKENKDFKKNELHECIISKTK